jgi:uncharacterized coiled-coil protein SlyX
LERCNIWICKEVTSNEQEEEMKDEKLKTIIQEAVINALTVEITLEKRRDEKTGVPLAVPKIQKEKVFLPSFLVQQISFQEGAFRGLQEDVNKKNNAIDKLADKLDVVGKTLLGMESSAKRLAGFTDALRLLQSNDVRILDEGNPEA